MSIVRAALLATVLSIPAMNLAAEVLVIDHANQYSTMNKPGNGITMAEVEARFGPPVEKRPAVGQPPITQWVYSDFVVYFEYERVIHSVAKRPVTP